MEAPILLSLMLPEAQLLLQAIEFYRHHSTTASLSLDSLHASLYNTVNSTVNSPSVTPTRTLSPSPAPSGGQDPADDITDSQCSPMVTLAASRVPGFSQSGQVHQGQPIHANWECQRNGIPLLPHEWTKSKSLSSANNHSASSLIADLGAATFDSNSCNPGSWAEALLRVMGKTRGVVSSGESIGELVGRCYLSSPSNGGPEVSVGALVGRCQSAVANEVVVSFFNMITHLQLAFKCQR